MFRLEEESLNELNHGTTKPHMADLSTTGRGASFNDGPGDKFLMRHHFPQSGSLKLGSAGRPHRMVGPNAGHVSAKLRFYLTVIECAHHSFNKKQVPVRERYGVEMTPLSYVPGGSIRKYLGNLNFFFIRESTSIRESGGVSGFVHSFITEVRADDVALCVRGINSSYYLSDASCGSSTRYCIRRQCAGQLLHDRTSIGRQSAQKSSKYTLLCANKYFALNWILFILGTMPYKRWW